MPDPHDKLFSVEARNREVFVECGIHSFTLTPMAASQLGTQLVKESLAAQQQKGAAKI